MSGVTTVLSERTRRFLAGGLAAATLLWLFALVVAPYLATHGNPGRVGAWASAGVYLAGAILCHQQPARTFHAWGTQLPVCARCLGLYGGAALGATAVVGARSPACRPWGATTSADLAEHVEEGAAGCRRTDGRNGAARVGGTSHGGQPSPGGGRRASGRGGQLVRGLEPVCMPLELEIGFLG